MARPRRAIPSAAAISELADADGRLKVRVTPSASIESITLPSPGGALAVRVTAPPEDGKANEAVLRLLADALQRPLSSLTLVRGFTSRNKVVQLTP